MQMYLSNYAKYANLTYTYTYMHMHQSGTVTVVATVATSQSNMYCSARKLMVPFLTIIYMNEEQFYCMYWRGRYILGWDQT